MDKMMLDNAGEICEKLIEINKLITKFNVTSFPDELLKIYSEINTYKLIYELKKLIN